MALGTDHCTAQNLDKFVIPLVEETERRRAAGKPNLFTTHMFDGSALSLKENLDIAAKLLERFRKSDLFLEIEAGVVGGEEDGMKASAAAKLYTTPEDTLEVARRLNPLGGRYLLGGDLRQCSRCLRAGARQASAVHSQGMPGRGDQALRHPARFNLVFHGGSGSSVEDIHAAIDYGVVKMNVDTDTQYAFTRAIAGHLFRNYDGALKVDGKWAIRRSTTLASI